MIIGLVILVILLLIIFPFRARGQLYVDPISLIAVYSIKIMFIKLLLGRIKLKITGFSVENAVNRIQPENSSIEEDAQIYKEIIKVIKIAKVNLLFVFGCGDACATSIVSGSALMIAGAIRGFVLSRNPNAKILSAVDARFNQTESNLLVTLTAKISLLQLLICLIKAKSKIVKEQKANVF